MREILVANREMVTLLHNLLGLDSFYLEFSFRATTHVLSCL